MRNLIVSTLTMTLVVSLVVGCHEASEEARAGRLTSESGKDSVTTDAAAEYSLPVRLGSSSEEVRKVLGRPNEFFSPPASNGMTLGYFYSSGIVARFDHDTLFGITLNTNSVPKGFLIYSGKVVNGVKLSDAKATILSKLGRPTKVEEDDLAVGIDVDVPVVSPKESRYYWRFSDYTVQADFLRQAQRLDETHILQKDALSLIQVYK